MGKYSNVNVSSLNSAVDKALDEIKNYDLSDVNATLSNNTTLDSGIETKVEDSLDLIISSENISGSIKVLKKQLNNLKDASSYIKKYQEAEKEIKELEKRLYKEEISYESTQNSKGETIINKVVEWVVDTYVKNRINVLKNDISFYEKRIDNYLS